MGKEKTYFIQNKSGKFKPEYVGKLNFYLFVVDELLKHEKASLDDL